MSPNLASYRLLEHRSQYKPCHVCVPDLEGRLAAICVDDRYYSFFRTVADGSKALEVAAKLGRRGDETVITKTAKGYVLWVLEPDAYLDGAEAIAPQAETPAQPTQTSTPCKILDSKSQYRTCHIRVPDLQQRLAALWVDGKYYALFKVVPTVDKAMEITARFGRRGDETVIAKTKKGYSVWVLEPEAYPAPTL